MRSDFPPGSKRVSDWVGMRVRSKVALRNGNNSMPAGTIYTVSYARSGLTMESEKCPCCGVSQYIRSVPPRDVEPAPADEPGVKGLGE